MHIMVDVLINNKGIIYFFLFSYITHVVNCPSLVLLDKYTIEPAIKYVDLVKYNLGVFLHTVVKSSGILMLPVTQN